jgi:hypothetical protein
VSTPVHIRKSPFPSPTFESDFRIHKASENGCQEFYAQLVSFVSLEEAVDLKIEEQRKFVAWWRGNVSIGESRRANRVPGSLPT